MYLPVKLALIRRQFAATGGAELYLQRLLGALAGAGHELHLFAEQWSKAPTGVTLHPVPVRASRATRPLAFAQAVEAQVQRQSFDCVLSFERTLRQDIYRAGDGVHRVWLERRRQFAPWWRRPFVGWGGFHRTMLALEAQTFDPSRTGAVIVNSTMVQREIVKHFAFPEQRIYRVRNGVDVDRFQSGKREETRRKFGFKDQDLVLLFVGSGWERKGLKYLLRAFEQLEIQQGSEMGAGGVYGDAPSTGPLSRVRVKLLVVGKGKLPWMPPDDCIFAGPMSAVEDAYAAADLFVFLPIYEPSANVVAEALAAGLPVITSAQNGASEWLEEGVNGTVLPDPSDQDAVTDAIVTWASRRFMARPADTDALRLDRNVEETLRVIHQVCELRKAGAL